MVDDVSKVESPRKKFPFMCLPGILGDFGRELSSNLQVADSIVGTSLLSIASLLTQNKGNVVVGYRKIPISLFTLIVADSGERKSTVDRILLESIREKERKDFNDLLLNIPGKIEVHPKILMQEPTIEGIFSQFESGHNALGLFSDEGAKMIGGYSMGKQVNTAGHLSNLWDGNPIERTRFSKRVKGMGHITPTLFNKRLSVCLMLQEPVFQKIWNNAFLQDQGLMARFLICTPPSLLGKRSYSHKENSSGLDRLKQTFEARLSELLDELGQGLTSYDQPIAVLPMKMKGIHLDKASMDRYIAFNNEIEQELDVGGVYRPIKAFAAKIAEQSLRIAAVCSFFEDSNAMIITETTYAKAVVLSRWYINEILNISNYDDFDTIDRSHKDVFNILLSRKNRGLSGLTLKEVTHRCVNKKIRNKRCLLPILESLQQQNMITFDGELWAVFDKVVTTNQNIPIEETKL